MKFHNKHFIQLSRDIFADEYKTLSINAKWLFVVLNELEHRFTGEKQDFFIRSNEQLSKDTGMSLSTLKRAKSELLKTGLVKTWKCHYVSNDTGKKSEVHYTAYKITE